MSDLPYDISVNTEKLKAFAGGYKEHAEAIQEAGRPIVSYIASLVQAMPEYDGRLQSAARAEANDIHGKCADFHKGFLEDSQSLTGIAEMFERIDGETVEKFTELKISIMGLTITLMVPSPAYLEEFYGKYQIYQGNTTHCGDNSLSMVCKIYYDGKGEYNPNCEVDRITEFLDKFYFRFPDLSRQFPSKEFFIEGGANPAGITAALINLGIPYVFKADGTLDDIENALREGKIVMVSIGKVNDPNQNGQTWGHVMVIVGQDGDDFLVLDPSQPEGTGVIRINKQKFLQDWWYDPVHPCWIIG